MNGRKCWQGHPCPSGQTCHSKGADIAGQGHCVPDSTPTHLITSYDCNNGNCTMRAGSAGRYPTKASCESQCKKGSLITSYDCNKGNCMMRAGSAGRYSTKASCESQCKKGSLTTSYDCNNGNCTIRYDSQGRYSTKAACDSQCAKGSLNMAWACPEDHNPGARCSKVPGFANGKTLFADEATCERATTCGAVPVNLLTEPDWEVGVAEGNPLQIIYSANVGNINDTVVNYM